LALGASAKPSSEARCWLVKPTAPMHSGRMSSAAGWLLVPAFVLGSAACASSSSPPPAEEPAPVSEDVSAPRGDATPPGPSPAPAARPALTDEACVEQGGSVVGDIGDGAIHRPDYVCPSGHPPLGNIESPAGGPMGVEGSVCCPK